MATFTAEDVKFLLTPPSLKERLKSRATGLVKTLGNMATKRLVSIPAENELTVVTPTTEAETTPRPTMWFPTVAENIAHFKRSGQWQRVDDAQVALRAAEEAKQAENSTQADAATSSVSSEVEANSTETPASTGLTKRQRGQGLSDFKPLGTEPDVYIPKHAGELVDEATMPTLTDPAKHRAGVHMAEVSALDINEGGHSVPGRHVAEVPVDFVQPTPGKHRA